MNTLEEWTKAVCVGLGLDRDEIDRDRVLDLTRDVAHGVARPAAPLTAYIVGLAVGRGMSASAAVSRVSALAEGWPGERADE